MEHTYSTGRVAALLGTTEPKVAELVRRGRTSPAPRVTSGRRLWERAHVLQAAACLAIDERAVARLLDAEARDET